MGQEAVAVLQVVCAGDIDDDVTPGWWRANDEVGACAPEVCGGAHREQQWPG